MLSGCRFMIPQMWFWRRAVRWRGVTWCQTRSTVSHRLCRETFRRGALEGSFIPVKSPEHTKSSCVIRTAVHWTNTEICVHNLRREFISRCCDRSCLLFLTEKVIQLGTQMRDSPAGQVEIMQSFTGVKLKCHFHTFFVSSGSWDFSV